MKIVKNNFLTILLQIRDNNEFTIRWLDFAYKLNCPFEIYIADGSIDNKIEKQLKKKKFSERLKIYYVYTGYDNDWTKYCSKILVALNNIKTPYILIADNDDFYNFKNIEKCIDNLNLNHEYVSCGGNVVHFNILDGDINGKNIKFNKQDKKPFINDDLLENLKLYLSNSTGGPYYYIHRKKIFKEGWKKNIDLNFRNPRMTELFMELYLLSFGKVNTLPITFYYRQYGKGIGNSAGLSNNFIDEIVKFNWHKDINNIFDMVSLKVSKLNKRNVIEIKRELLDHFKVFLRPWLINSIDIIGQSFQAKISRKLMLKNALKYGLLKNVYNVIRPIKSSLIHFFYISNKKNIKDIKILSKFLQNYKK